MKECEKRVRLSNVRRSENIEKEKENNKYLKIIEDIKIFQMPSDYTPVRWGDIVRIHGINTGKNKSTPGLIISKGFTDHDIYYQLYEEFKEVNFYRQSLFQILPNTNFDMHDQLLLPSLGAQEREQTQERAEGQKSIFRLYFEEKKQKNISYGSTIVFKHLQSQSYLRGMLKAADTGKGAFKVEVTSSLSSEVVFKLISPRTYESDKDNIYYGDGMKIYHPSSDCYMNFSPSQNQPIYLDRKEDLQEVPQNHEFHPFVLNRPMIKKPVGIRIPIINESKSKCQWKFLLHCSSEEYEQKDKIKSHDIVYFEHTKNKGLVSSTLSKPVKYYLKQSNWGEKELSYECFWELIPKSQEDSSVFCARNIITDQLLNFEDFDVEIRPAGEEETELKKEGLVNLGCSEVHEENKEVFDKLERGELLPFEEGRQKIVENYEKKIKRIKFVSVKKMSEDIFRIYQVNEETMKNVQYALSSYELLIKFVETMSSRLIKDREDYTEFFQPLEQSVLNSVVNILQLLIGRIYKVQYTEIESSGNPPDKEFQKILVESGITIVLIEIINLLFKPFIFIIENSNIPSDDKAIRSKIGQIFEFSYRLIEKIAANNELNRMYISRWVDLFLTHSKSINLPFIQECLVGILKNNPESILATINEEKIKILIKCFIEEARNPLQTKQSELTTKYLRLFSTFIKCEGRVIKQNQNIILNEFFRDPEHQFNFKFKHEFRRNWNEEYDMNDPISKLRTREVLISFGKKGQFIDITTFFNQYPDKWNYFLAYIDLLADVCMDRNNEAIQAVSNVLGLVNVATILFDPEVEELNDKIKKWEGAERTFQFQNIHQPFVRIAHHAYVDNSKFNIIKKIKKINLWYKKNDDKNIDPNTEEEINRTKRVFEGEKEEEEGQHLDCILSYITTYLRSCGPSNINLHMLYTVLNLLKTTISLGLWKKMKSFRELIPLLVFRINKIDEIEFSTTEKDQRAFIEERKEKFKLKNPELAQSIDCKIKVTEIFTLINELEIDIRLRYIMNFFTGIYKATEDFNVYDFIEDDRVPMPEEGQECQDPVIKRNAIAKSEYMKMDGKAILGDVSKVADTEQILLKEQIWFNKLQELTPFTYEETDDPKKNRYLFQGQPTEVTDQDTHFNNIVLALFQSPVYSNQKLLNASLKMLKSIFEQRRSLLDNFKAMIIAGKGNLQEVYSTLKFMRGKFNMLCSDSITFYEGNHDKAFPYAIWKPYDYLVKDRERRSGLIQDLFFLAETLKEGTKLKNMEALMHVDEDIFNPDQVYVPINERQKNNSLFQAVNLAEGVYIPLINYIQIIGLPNVLPENHRKLLVSIYRYLTYLCFNNLEAKQHLMKYIPVILPHLKKKVGADSFIYEITRNNKILINNEQLVTQIIQTALEACVQYQNTLPIAQTILHQEMEQDSPSTSHDFEKSRLLFCLRGMLLFNDEGQTKNQEILMNEIQKTAYKKLILQEPFKFFDKINNFNLSPIECYTANHFELFAAMVQSGNLINIGKLENIHPYDRCLDMLKNTNRWQIRRAVRSYLNRLYYVNKEKELFIFEEFIRNQFDIINRELKDLIEIHRSGQLTNDLKIKNGIRFTYAESEIMLMIIEILNTLHEIFLKVHKKYGFIKVLREQLRKEERKNTDFQKLYLHRKIVRLYKNLGKLYKLYPETKLISPFILQVKRLLEGVIKNMKVRFLEKKSQPGDKESDCEGGLERDDMGKDQLKDEEVDMAQIEKTGYVMDRTKSFFRNLHQMLKFFQKKKKLIKTKELFQNSKNDATAPEEVQTQKYMKLIFENDAERIRPMHVKKVEVEVPRYNPHLQTAESRVYKLLAKPDFSEDEENIELNRKITRVKTMLEESPIIDKFKDEQFIKLVQAFSKLDDTSVNYYAEVLKEEENPAPIISKREIISTSFKLIMQNSDQFQDTEKVFIIKLMRCYITEGAEQDQQYKLAVDKWDAEYISESEELQSRQKEVEQCGGSDFIIKIFEENLVGREYLLNEALLFGIAYLYGGNKDCQSSILKVLKSDPDNKMLLSIRTLIKTIGDFLISIRKYKEGERPRDFSYNIVDTYDYYSPSENAILKYFSQRTIDKFQLQNQLNHEKALCRLFRFLQLFCENDNQQMKKFLYEQINDDDGAKTNTINFIEETCLLLKKILKLMNDKLVKLPNNILAFIGEITQLPILDNQISLLKSTFFEDLSFMSEFFNSKKNRSMRKFLEEASDEDDPLFDLLSISDQGVGLALSNFEGNDPLIVKEFLSKCKPTFLWLVIQNNLWYLLKNSYPHYITRRQDKQLLEDMQETFSRLVAEEVEKIVEGQKAKGKQFEGRFVSILNVFMILNKIRDFAQEMDAIGKKDVENPNNEFNVSSKKAMKFIQEVEEKGKQIYEEFAFFKRICESLILQIQVKCNNGNKSNKTSKQFIYFPKEPVFSHISMNMDKTNYPKFSFFADETRDNIMMNVGRATQRDKLTDLLGFREEIYREIEQNYTLNYENTLDLYVVKKKFPITSSYCEQVRDFARKCSYLICLLMGFFIFVDHDTRQQSSYFTFTSSAEQILIRSLCIIQLSATLFYCYLWGKMRSNLALQKINSEGQGGGEEQEAEQQGEEEAEEEPQAIEEGEEPAINGKQQEQFDLAAYLRPSLESWPSFLRIPASLLLPILAILYSLCIKGQMFIQCFIISPLTLITDKIISFFVNSYHLFLNFLKRLHERITSNILYRYLLGPIVNQIYRLLIKPVYDFYVTLMALKDTESGFGSLALFVVASFLGNFYGVQWYTIHLFDFFVNIPILANVFKAIFQNIGELTTLSLLATVFIFVFNILSLSTYTPVIWEDDLPEESCETVLSCVLDLYTSGAINDSMDQFVFDRFFFDVVYTVFMSMLFENLVGGIMVDGFSSLRAEDEERDADKHGKCYICSMQKANMQKQGETFKKHTNKHLMWNYVFYIYWMSKKDDTDLTGIEYMIKNQIDSEEIDWFPTVDEDDGGNVEEIMEEVQGVVNSFIQHSTQQISYVSQEIDNLNNLVKPKEANE